MQAIVLEKPNQISIRDIDLPVRPGPRDVKIQISRVGICGSDLHYYLHGRIGDFVVRDPMVLGHEASGVVTEVGTEVSGFSVGDRVCMEPGIFRDFSPEVMRGQYNLDPAVEFWATPPVHGCMCESVIHPANLTFHLPESVDAEEGALVEPLAIGVHSATKARIAPGDTALVIGAGTIGIVTALAASASGCDRVFVTDVKQAKLDFVAEHYGANITPINPLSTDLGGALRDAVPEGVDVAFETSGSDEGVLRLPQYVRRGGRMVFIGMPQNPPPFDIVTAQTKELTMYTVFRYANAYPRAIRLLSSGRINAKPLVTHRFPFSDGKAAFEYAATYPQDAIKIMITM